MAKKAWRETHQQYLDQLVDLATLHRTVSDIDRRDYKEDYFRIFADAYQNHYCVTAYIEDLERDRLVPAKTQRPLILGDTIRDLSRSKDLHPDSAAHLHRLAEWWDEWVFAWSHERPKRKYTRRGPGNG